MTSHPAITNALKAWREVRAEFQDYLEAQYQQAETDCNGVLLNTRGRERGVSAFSLFYGPAVRVRAYASEELRQWFLRHGRQTFQQYEQARTGCHGRRWGELITEWDDEDGEAYQWTA